MQVRMKIFLKKIYCYSKNNTFAAENKYSFIRYKKTILRGRVTRPAVTAGNSRPAVIVRDSRNSGTEPVKFRCRQYSLDGRRNNLWCNNHF